MNIVPTKRTQLLGEAMVRAARRESGADAVMEMWEEIDHDQLPALLGMLLNRVVAETEGSSAPIHIEGTCLGCDLRTRDLRRRLCPTCYAMHKNAGTLDQFPTVRQSNAELMAEWKHLRDQGYTIKTAAQVLGMTADALSKAIERAARRREDELRAQQRAADSQPDTATARRRAVLAEAYRETAEGAA